MPGAPCPAEPGRASHSVLAQRPVSTPSFSAHAQRPRSATFLSTHGAPAGALPVPSRGPLCLARHVQRGACVPAKPHCAIAVQNCAHTHCAVRAMLHRSSESSESSGWVDRARASSDAPQQTSTYCDILDRARLTRKDSDARGSSERQNPKEHALESRREPFLAQGQPASPASRPCPGVEVVTTGLSKAGTGSHCQP